MTSPFTRRGDSGSPTFGHALLSSGDELAESSLSKKRRFSGRRKTPKPKKKKTRQTSRLGAANESDASVEDAEEGENNGDAGLALDTSEDEDEDKPKASAPSVPARKSAMANHKVKRRSLITPQQQTGRNKSSSMSPKAIRQQLPSSSPYRTRTSEKVRFDLDNVARRSPTPVDEDGAESVYTGNLTDDLHSDSDNDDAHYERINLISDSDVEEENDDAIESAETDFLIKHLEESGALHDLIEFEEESVFSDMYNDLAESVRYNANTESDLDNFFAAIPTTELMHNNDASATSENSPILGPTTGGASSLQMENAIDLLPRSGRRSHIFKIDPTETGLHTPASQPQSIILRDYDDSEVTEDEEPQVKSVSGARLQRVAGLVPHQATPSRVRKNSKPKTPKRGTFKISKKATVIKHDKDGKLVISKKGKIAASGTITPKGLLTCDSKRQKPIPLADSFTRAITAPSSALASPTFDGSFFPSYPLQDSPFLKSEVGDVIKTPFTTASEDAVLSAGIIAEEVYAGPIGGMIPFPLGDN